MRTRALSPWEPPATNHSVRTVASPMRVAPTIARMHEISVHSQPQNGQGAGARSTTDVARPRRRDDRMKRRQFITLLAGTPISEALAESWKVLPQCRLATRRLAR